MLQEVIYGLGERSVAAADDDHRRAVDRGAHFPGHRLRIVYGPGIDQVDARRPEFLAGRFKSLGAATACGVDDEYRLLGKVCGHLGAKRRRPFWVPDPAAMRLEDPA